MSLMRSQALRDTGFIFNNDVYFMGLLCVYLMLDFNLKSHLWLQLLNPCNGVESIINEVQYHKEAFSLNDQAQVPAHHSISLKFC